mmetsp:Transcript_26125/g.63712  ORF Transcript_26125/g.63712 Transcript_26125/m.63712 type:complete len:114 (-) Transcript_26125:8-349(-)
MNRSVAKACDSKDGYSLAYCTMRWDVVLQCWRSPTEYPVQDPIIKGRSGPAPVIDPTIPQEKPKVMEVSDDETKASPTNRARDGRLDPESWTNDESPSSSGASAMIQYYSRVV